MTTATNTIHRFEKAGLGIAPFTVVGMSEKVITLPGGYTKAAGTCDFCGTGIRYQFHIRSADNRTFIVGSDCVEKTGDKGMIAVVANKINEFKKAAKAAKENAAIEAAIAKLPQVRGTFAAQSHPCIPEKTMLDYVNWMLANAGSSGKLRIARMIEAA